MDKKKKRWVMILAAILVLLMVLPTLITIISTTAHAASSSEIAAQMQELDRQWKALEAEAASIADEKFAVEAKLGENQQETKSVVDEKYYLDQQIELINLDIDNTNAKIQVQNTMIAAKQEELDQALTEEAAQYETFKERIRAMEENGSVSYLSILFNAASFSDLLDRIDLIGEIAEYDKQVIKQLTAAREKIAETQDELELQKSELNQSKEALAQKEEELAGKRAEADALLTSLYSEAGAYSDEIAQYEQEEEQMQSYILEIIAAYDQKAEEKKTAEAAEEAERKRQEAEAEARRKAALSSSSGNSSTYYYSYYSSVSVAESGFLYPLPAGVATISCAFGMRTHPITGAYKLHTGVDLAAPSGTNIYASKSGTVVTSGYSGAYGNYVVISHGGGQATLYGHMSSRAVSAGDYVSQGETIGYVGTTGYSTGNHLHFEIIIDGDYMNPMNYISLK